MTTSPTCGFSTYLSNCYRAAPTGDVPLAATVTVFFRLNIVLVMAASSALDASGAIQLATLLVMFAALNMNPVASIFVLPAAFGCSFFPNKYLHNYTQFFKVYSIN